MEGALGPGGGVRRDGAVLEGGGDEEEDGVQEGAGAGGSVRWRSRSRGGGGEEMAKFFDECVRLKKRHKSAERYHWCAIGVREALKAAAERHHHLWASDGSDGGGAARERGRGGNGEAPEEISAHPLG